MNDSHSQWITSRGPANYAVPGGRRSNFQHKSLTYRYSDGAITVG